jgi:hypothetical protein
MLSVVSHFSLFSPFAARQDQNGENSLPCTAIRVTQGKRLSRLRERKAFFANFAFFAICGHIPALSSVPYTRNRAGSGGSVKGKPCRAATRPLTFAAVLPAINACGRGTEMTPSGACFGNIPQRQKGERQSGNLAGLRWAFSDQRSPVVISNSQHTRCAHRAQRAPASGYAPSNPAKAKDR